jgi:hypothetical protein
MNEECEYLLEYPALTNFIAGNTPAQFNWCVMRNLSKLSATSWSFGLRHLKVENWPREGIVVGLEFVNNPELSERQIKPT